MRTINPRLRGATSQPRHLHQRPSPQLIADGVVASYIHDISARHQDQDASKRDAELRQPRIARLRGAERSFRNQLAAPQLDAA